MSNGWERIRLRVETKEGLAAQNMTSDDTRTISCHVLDTALGKAVSNLPLIIYRQANSGEWQELTQSTTNEDGRASLSMPSESQSGIYKLRFQVEKYFDAAKTSSFYPFIEIVIKCESDRGQHYHVPLLLSPFGYTTYRGT